MISLDSSEKDVAEIERETLSLKNAQPFYDGQLNTYIVDSGNTYDFSLSGDFTYGHIVGNVRFNNNSKKLPFCKIIPVIGTLPGTQASVAQVRCQSEYRTKALYNQGSVVGWNFKFSVFTSAPTLYIKYYAITNDTGGIFEIYGGDWVKTV